MSKPCVAIVEDENTIALLLEEFLEELGYEVGAIIPSVEKGLQIIQSLDIDVAVLDVRLSDGLSFPLAAILQERNIPFIFATGSCFDIESQFSSVPVLSKPFKMNQLETQLSLVLQH